MVFKLHGASEPPAGKTLLNPTQSVSDLLVLGICISKTFLSDAAAAAGRGPSSENHCV